MRKPFRPQLQTRALDQDDWQAFRDFAVRCSGGECLEMYVCWEDPGDPLAWQRQLSAENGHLFFGLFDNERLIGTSGIQFQADGSAEFCDLRIEPDYQKQGLADVLHGVRKRYLAQRGFTGPVTVAIYAGNTPSLKAAERNGFRLTEIQERHHPTGSATFHRFSLQMK